MNSLINVLGGLVIELTSGNPEIKTVLPLPPFLPFFLPLSLPLCHPPTVSLSLTASRQKWSTVEGLTGYEIPLYRLSQYGIIERILIWQLKH